jgi:hypothetical protein
MNKTLDIIIAHFNEPWEITSHGIEMLKNQKAFDSDQVRVTLIHDGSKNFDELKTMHFPFIFREICIPHQGISAVRNHGIDISDAKWITFCDCDDYYSSVYSLRKILEGLKDDRFDLMWSKYYVEGTEDGDQMRLGFHEFNTVWIHNKYYRLDFLKEHHIRFNTDLTICEDGAFNMMAYLEMEQNRIGEIVTTEPLYTWLRRKNSTTTNEANLMKVTKGVLERDIYVTKLFEERRRITTRLMAARTITDAYASLTQKRLEPYPNEIEDILSMIKQFWNDNILSLEQVTLAEWNYVLKASENECAIKGVLNQYRPTLDDWLAMKLGVERRYAQTIGYRDNTL